MVSMPGHVRLGRFAAVTIPATVASLAIGAGIVQGVVGAAISTSGGFELNAPTVNAARMALAASSADVANGVSSTSTSTKQSTIARLTDNSLPSGMCVGANQKFPIIGNIGFAITTTGKVNIADLDLNAADLNLGTADLPATVIGNSVASTDLNGAAGTQAGGFGLQSTSGSGQQVKLSGVKATAYGISLKSGLKLTSLGIKPTIVSDGTKVCG